MIFLLLAGCAIAAAEGSAVTGPLSTEPDAQAIVGRAFAVYRGQASVSTAEMTIHRPDWERRQVLKAWTRGEEESLFTTIEPSRDRGNGTLKKGDEMWIFNPKVNRVIKLPPSMMSQSWMGSDFSNNDLAKSDSIIHHYTHRLLETGERDGHRIHRIESVPKPGAPVVWGKQHLLIRDDHVFLEQAFHDEDGALVKTLAFDQIRRVGDQLYPHRLTMTPEDEEGHYTRVEYREVEFLDSLPDRVFTQSTLRNPPLHRY